MRKLIISMSILVILGLSIFFSFFYTWTEVAGITPINNNEPVSIIQSEFGIKLPPSAKVIKFDFDNNSDERLDTKILIQKELVNYIKNSVTSRYGIIPKTPDEHYLPNFENTCKWWDMDKSNVIVAYSQFYDVKRRSILSEVMMTSGERWVMISTDSAGKYYLYLSSCY
jgi:hypothetical protein